MPIIEHDHQWVNLGPIGATGSGFIIVCRQEQDKLMPFGRIISRCTGDNCSGVLVEKLKTEGDDIPPLVLDNDLLRLLEGGEERKRVSSHSVLGPLSPQDIIYIYSEN